MQREFNSVLTRLASEGLQKQYLTFSMEILPKNAHLGDLERAKQQNFRGKRAVSGGSLENHNFQPDGDSL